MRLISKFVLAAGAVAVASILAAAPASAQTKLKWAHVYETSEPFHKWSVWAADEIKKRTNGRYEVQVFPASSLGKETDINQGLTLGTVDIIISGLSFAALAAGVSCTGNATSPSGAAGATIAGTDRELPA